MSGIGEMKILAYSTESDICRAYHTVKHHGVPDEIIVVFMADIAVNSSYNPHPGTLYNEENGANVYNGAPKDFTRRNWTIQNFLDVLEGRKMNIGSAKTLKTAQKKEF